MDGIPNYHFNGNLINFFKRFTINASKNWKSRNVKGTGNILKDTWRWVKPGKEKNEQKEIVNTQKLWRISRDPAVSPEIAKQANSSLVEILTQVSRAEIVQYLATTINYLLTQEDFIKNCRFLLGFLNSIRLDADDIDFMKLNADFGGIVSCIINKLQQQVHEMFFIRNLSPSTFESDISTLENVQEFLSEYKTTHMEALNCIECIIVNTNVELSNEEVDSLFMIFVDQYKFPENGQDLLFSLFLKSKLNGPVLNQANRRYLFERILCNQKRMNCTNLTPKLFYCFLYLFVKINNEEELLSYNSAEFVKIFRNDVGKEGNYYASQPETKIKYKDCFKKILREVSSFAILGFETLWKILCSTQYEDILDQGCIFLN